MNLRAVLLIVLSAGVNAQAANPLITVSTNFGDMVFELYPDKAPITVANFLNYANNGHYDGTVFHRVINQFILQGGGYSLDLEHRPTLPPILNEADNGLKNEPGTLAMAHGYEPDSATSQFYINLVDNKYLNHLSPQSKYFGYCVFGKMLKGWDVARNIATLPTGAYGRFPSDVPFLPVVIEQVTFAPAPAQEIIASATKLKRTKKCLKKPKEIAHG